MPADALKCPFCPKSFSYRAGIASHVRSAHPKQYAKWKRELPAQEKQPSSSSKGKASAPALSQEKAVTASSAPVNAPQKADQGTSHASTLLHLKQSREQLLQRKRAVEEEIKPFEKLKREMESITSRVEALDAVISHLGSPAAEAPAAPQAQKSAGPAASAIVPTEPKFNGNKRAFVEDIVKSRNASGITPYEIERIFTDQKIRRGKNLIYNALSVMVKQGDLRRKDGRYFASTAK